MHNGEAGTVAAQYSGGVLRRGQISTRPGSAGCRGWHESAATRGYGDFRAQCEKHRTPLELDIRDIYPAREISWVQSFPCAGPDIRDMLPVRFGRRCLSRHGWAPREGPLPTPAPRSRSQAGPTHSSVVRSGSARRAHGPAVCSRCFVDQSRHERHTVGERCGRGRAVGVVDLSRASAEYAQAATAAPSSSCAGGGARRAVWEAM